MFKMKTQSFDAMMVTIVLGLLTVLPAMLQAYPRQGLCSDPIVQYERHTTNCTKYYRCFAGKAIEYMCQSGRLWNHHISKCDWADRLPADVKAHCAGKPAERNVLHQSGQLNLENTDIAFSVVSHKSFGPVSQNTNIPMEVILTNIGGGWSEGVAAFRAPLAGYYQFTATIYSEADYNSKAAIVRGTRQIVSMATSVAGGTGTSNTAILYVQEGEYVSLQLRPVLTAIIHSYEDETYTSFSGQLLFT